MIFQKWILALGINEKVTTKAEAICMTAVPIRTHIRTTVWGARWLSGRVSDSGARGPGFETYRRRVVSLSKTLYSPKVLVNYPGSNGSVPIWLKNCWLGRKASTQPTNQPHHCHADKNAYPHNRNVTDDLCSLIIPLQNGVLGGILFSACPSFRPSINI